MVRAVDMPAGSRLEVGEIAAIAAALPDAVVVIDAQATIRWANTAAERLMGSSLEAWIGTSGLGLVHPDDVGLAALSLGSVQDKQVGTPIELRITAATGWTLVELVGAPLGDGDIVLCMRDVTQRRRWEVAGDDTARFRSLVQNGAGLTMLLAADGTVQSASGAITRLLGLDPELVCGHPLSAIIEPDDHPALALAMATATGRVDGGPATFEVRLLSARGEGVPFELNIVSLLDDPTVEGLVVSGHDITRLRAAQDALEQLASYDPLTGLANRRTFDAALQREWTLTSRDGIDSVVVVADLDGFKQVNDQYGHAAGDEALRQFGHTLRHVTRETDVVARIGGDEFAVVLIRCGGEAAAIGLEARLREELASRAWPGGRILGVSVGHHSLRKSRSPGDALHLADLAMLDDKRQR